MSANGAAAETHTDSRRLHTNKDANRKRLLIRSLMKKVRWKHWQNVLGFCFLNLLVCLHRFQLWFGKHTKTLMFEFRRYRRPGLTKTTSRKVGKLKVQKLPKVKICKSIRWNFCWKIDSCGFESVCGSRQTRLKTFPIEDRSGPQAGQWTGMGTSHLFPAVPVTDSTGTDARDDITHTCAF